MSRPGKKYIYRGKVLSMSDIAKEVDVSCVTINVKLRGVPPMTDVTTRVSECHRSVKRCWEYKGNVVDAQYLAELKYCATSTILNLLRRQSTGAKVDDIIDNWECNNRKYYYHGVLMPVYDISRACGSYSMCAVYRILRGVRAGEDVTDLVDDNRRRGREFVYNGKVVDMHDLVNLTGFAYGTVRCRLRGIEDKQDVTELLQHHPYGTLTYVYDGRSVSARELSDMLGIEISKVRYKLINVCPNTDVTYLFSKSQPTKNSF